MYIQYFRVGRFFGIGKQKLLCDQAMHVTNCSPNLAMESNTKLRLAPLPATVQILVLLYAELQ